MAAWIPKNTVKLARGYNACASSHAIQLCCHSTQPNIIKNPTTAKLKRGTGGRSSFNGMVCTVFGATGFVGAVVCNQLGKIGSQLILPYRSDYYAAQRLKLCGDLGQVLFHPFHLRDEESIERCIRYSNVVINLVGQERETRNFTYHDVHVTGARTLARLCKENNVERFIHLTRTTARPDIEGRVIKSGSKFLQSKWEGECAVREEFPDATIIRASDIFDYGDRFTRLYFSMFRYSSASLPLWEKGEKTEKQPVWISDVSQGIVRIALDNSAAGKTYQFVGPKRYRLCDIVTWLNHLQEPDEEFNEFKIVDIEKHLLYKAQVAVIDASHLYNIFGDLSWERLEMESQTDVLERDLPGLPDLGVELTPMEDIVTQYAMRQANVSSYVEFARILDPIPPPRTVPVPM